MFSVQKSLAAAAFSFAAAGLSVAQQPSPLSLMPLKMGASKAVSVQGRPDRNYQLYVLQEDVKAGGRYTRGHVLVDKALDIACEWNEVGQKLPDANGVFYAQPQGYERMGCVQSPRVPASWAELMPRNYAMEQQLVIKSLLENGMDPETAQKTFSGIEEGERVALGHLSLHKKNSLLLMEKVLGGNPHAIPGLGIVHAWDLANNKVCLITSQTVYDNGAKRTQPAFNWGCFPAANLPYFQRVQAAFGVKDL